MQAAGVAAGREVDSRSTSSSTSSTDPFEEKDLAADKPEDVAKLKEEYETWFADVTRKGFAPPRIVIGSEKENPVRLSRQDWRGPKGRLDGSKARGIGNWSQKEAVVTRLLFITWRR